MVLVVMVVRGGKHRAAAAQATRGPTLQTNTPSSQPRAHRGSEGVGHAVQLRHCPVLLLRLSLLAQRQALGRLGTHAAAYAPPARPSKGRCQGTIAGCGNPTATPPPPHHAHGGAPHIARKHTTGAKGPMHMQVATPPHTSPTHETLHGQHPHTTHGERQRQAPLQPRSTRSHAGTLAASSIDTASTSR
jgi:hypothetical protein